MNDRTGKVFCSPPDGGIEVDIGGVLQCGPGSCTRDSHGKVFCSNTPRGASTLDRYGKAVCTGACVSGQTDRCVAQNS